MKRTAARTKTRTLLPCFELFVTRVRALFADEMADKERWLRAKEYVAELIAEPELIEHSKSWPVTGTNENVQNLLFYVDPDHGFAVNALVKGPHKSTSIHDHGRTYTIYGVVSGQETITRHERLDAGPRHPTAAELRETGEVQCGPGAIDFVEPWEIHAERSGAGRVVGFILRSEKPGGYSQNRFSGGDGIVDVVKFDAGPEQIEYDLA